MLKTYTDENTYNQLLNQYFGVNTDEELEEVLRLEYKRNQAVEDYVSDNLTDKEIISIAKKIGIDKLLVLGKGEKLSGGTVNTSTGDFNFEDDAPSTVVAAGAFQPADITIEERERVNDLMKKLGL